MDAIAPGGNEDCASFTLLRSFDQIACNAALEGENSYFISTLILDKPADDVDFKLSTSCICCIADSSGSVISFATSVGVAPGY